MLLSELIKNCNELLNEYGDGEVFFPYQGMFYEPCVSKSPSIVSEWIEDAEIFYDTHQMKYLLGLIRPKSERSEAPTHD